MKNNRKILRLPVAFLGLVLCGNAPSPSPADLYGDLFSAIQEQHVFEDGKTFADAAAKTPPQDIVAAYNREKPNTPAKLRAFALRFFIVPGVNDKNPSNIREHVRSLWPTLMRIDKSSLAEENSSLINLPHHYIVPGGRFRESYYWDSYFTMLGLVADKRDDLVESMIDNFTSLIERFGHIPNGTRTYYLSRSQPPFFALMLDLSKQADPAVRARRLAALRKEYAYWMAGEGCALKSKKPCDRVMPMPDGSLLNRYWDDRDTPRDESFAEDRATAAKESGRPPQQMYRNLRAGAESGWDFSSRWLTDPKNLSTIETTSIVPIDLNALLWAIERHIAEQCAQTGDRPCANEFVKRADLRKASVDRYLWLGKEARYSDWAWYDRKATPVLSSATLYPLFVGMASTGQARAVANTTRDKLIAPGGLRTTNLRTGQQWDAPNGWAPLQWVAIDGLERYGHKDLAQNIATRWIKTVEVTYHETGKMLEKYDVEERLPGGGGEYPLQDGFGWTNGVASAILERYPISTN
ncbi:alpha,alpha-trehalase TreF [Novosphingobium sp. PhB55]|uniref:alpha,alpha-trehalase TreF n=1 Tax=Novosphingobium sp. PhB55 TaxID=2485106 RepID=UPI001FBA2C2C|nr:alpha,alpha-trehalase TreF [Novosphingobium sp. PhB55]